MNFEKSEAVKRLPQQFFAQLRGNIEQISKQTEEKIINLAIGTPDLLPPKLLRNELKKAVDNPVNNKYGPYRGNTYLKQAAADYYKDKFQVSIDPETEVAVFDGSKGGIAKLSQALLNAGDSVLLPDPSYPDYRSGIALTDAEVESLPLVSENQYLIDYDAISPEVAEKAKLLFINYPNNPTGVSAPPDFFEKTVEFAKKYNVCIAHDAAYARIIFDGKAPVSYLQAPEAKEYGIEFFSLSKMFNISGWRVGFAVGNSSVIESMNLLQDHTTVSLYGGIQQASAKMLNEDESFVDELKDIYQNRRDIFIKEVNQAISDIKVPEGSFFIWMKVPEKFTSKEFVHYLLTDAHVVVADGSGFGSYGEGYVRVSLVDSEENIKEAAIRIKESVLKNKK